MPSAISITPPWLLLHGICELRLLTQIAGLRKKSDYAESDQFQRPEALDEWRTQFPVLDISFKTAHSSKGLQADYVILLGLHTGSYAFPSEISDDPLLQLVMPQAESFPNAEERRLFYVAMTRARHCVYLLGGRDSPSAFRTELVNDNKGMRTSKMADGKPLGSVDFETSFNP